MLENVKKETLLRENHCSVFFEKNFLRKKKLTSIAIVTFLMLSRYSKKYSETIFKILIMKVSKYFSLQREDGVSV